MDLDLIRNSAVSIYKRYVAGTDHEMRLAMDDLIHAGVIGYLDGKRRLQPCSADQERVFLRYRVKGAMLDMLRTMPLVRMPRERAVLVKQLKEESRRTESLSAGERQTDKVTAVKADAALAEAPKIVFGQQMGDRDGKEEGGIFDKLAGSDNPQISSALRKEIARLIEYCLAHLNAEQRLILTARYLEDMKLKDLAPRFSLTVQAVHYREKQALAQMRSCLEGNGWRWTGSEGDIFADR